MGHAMRRAANSNATAVSASNPTPAFSCVSRGNQCWISRHPAPSHHSVPHASSTIDQVRSLSVRSSRRRCTNHALNSPARPTSSAPTKSLFSNGQGRSGCTACQNVRPDANASAGAELQQQAERPHRAPTLPHADPQHRGPFERPRRRRPARIERERNRDRREDDAEREKGFGQRPGTLVAPCMEQPGQDEVHRGHADRAEGHAIGQVAHQSALQARHEQRRPEDERAVDVAAQPERSTQRIEHRDRDVEQEEQDQERFGRWRSARGDSASRPTSVAMTKVNRKPSRFRLRHALNQAMPRMPALSSA